MGHQGAKTGLQKKMEGSVQEKSERNNRLRENRQTNTRSERSALNLSVRSRAAILFWWSHEGACPDHFDLALDGYHTTPDGAAVRLWEPALA